MSTMRKIFILLLLSTWHLAMVSGQNYNSRVNVPMKEIPYTPIDDMDYMDYDYYSFKEGEPNIYRWNVDRIPHPQKQFPYCKRVKPSFVCDPDEILTREQADKLDSYIMQLYNETLCICGEECETSSGGIVVGIALIRYMYQPFNQHPSKTIRDFAEHVRRAWSLGSCENDIVIVVATADRLSYTDVGKSTSAYMSLTEAHTIFLENKGNFSNGHFFEGLSSMLADYHKFTRNMKLAVQKKDLDVGKISGIIIGAIALLGIVLFIGFALFSYCRRRRNKDPEKVVDEPDHDTEGISSSWRKQDIKVMFGSLKSTHKPLPQSTQYSPCDTEEKELPRNNFTIEEEELDTNPASSVTPNQTQGTVTTGDSSTTTTGDTSTSELLDKELSDAVEGIAQTFQTFQPKRNFRGHETDL